MSWAFVPVDEVEDLSAARLHPCQPELPSEPVGRLGEGDAMSALGRDPRRLESGRAASRHQDLARGVGPGEPVPAPFELEVAAGAHRHVVVEAA